MIPKAQLNNLRVIKVSHLQRVFLDFLDTFQCLALNHSRWPSTSSDPGLPTSRYLPELHCGGAGEGGEEGRRVGGGVERTSCRTFHIIGLFLRIASQHLRPGQPPCLTIATVERGDALQFSAGSGDPGTLPDFFPLLFFSPPLLLLPQDLLESLGSVKNLRTEAGHDLMGNSFQ